MAFGNLDDIVLTMISCDVKPWNNSTGSSSKFYCVRLLFQRNHHGPSENTTDPSRAIQNGSVDGKNNVSPSFPKNVQNPIVSDPSTTIQKGCIPGSSTEVVPLTMQMRLDMFDPVVSGGMVTQQMLELPVSNPDMASNLQPQVWLSKPTKDNHIVSDNTLKEQEEVKIDSGSESDSISSAYSQRWVSLINSEQCFLPDFMLAMCLKLLFLRVWTHFVCVTKGNANVLVFILDYHNSTFQLCLWVV